MRKSGELLYPVFASDDYVLIGSVKTFTIPGRPSTTSDWKLFPVAGLYPAVAPRQKRVRPRPPSHRRFVRHRSPGRPVPPVRALAFTRSKGVKTVRRLILRSFQSPGDVLMLTAAVRDLHVAAPGRFQTDV